MPHRFASPVAFVAVARPLVAVLLFTSVLVSTASGQGISAALARLLTNESLPPERLPAIIEMAGKRGNAEVLGLVFEKAAEADTWPAEIKTAALRALAEAANKRKITPEGDLARLKTFLEADRPPKLRNQAIRLAGLWQTNEIAPKLENLLANPQTPASTRLAALEALSQFGDSGRETIARLARAEDLPVSLRVPAISALAAIDLEAAAKTAASLLATASAKDDLGAILGIFLERKGGPEALAGVLSKIKLSPEVARAALEALYAQGRNDAKLSTALAEAAGITMDDKSLSPADIQELIDDVLTQGNAARGQLVFRRDDLSCLKCHTVSGAGGQIGPDLSGVGPSHPIDHLVKAVVKPSDAVKEQFATQNVVTAEGLVVTGVVAKETADVLVLTTAEGERRVIPKADIIDRQSGGSLMPQGLVKFMTRQQLLDLVRFLSQLGRPGTPYALNASPTIQRWRLLAVPPTSFQGQVPDEATIGRDLPPLSAPNWEPFYSRVNGTIHPADLGSRAAYLRADIDVTSGGPIALRINDVSGIDLWLNGEYIESLDRRTVVELPEGRHTIVVRLDPAVRGNVPLSVAVVPPPGSKAKAKPTGGI